jgi:hypothetical protein
VGFVVNKAANGQDFSVYFAFPCQYHSIKAPYMLLLSLEKTGESWKPSKKPPPIGILRTFERKWEQV